MNDICARYSSDVDFLTIYIREAHPIGGWEAPDQPEQFRVRQATVAAERMEAARKFFAFCATKGMLAMDDMEDHASALYAGFPDRIFVIREGRFIYAQKQGPFGYEPRALEEFLAARAGRS